MKNKTFWGIVLAVLVGFPVLADYTLGPEFWNLYRGTSIIQRDFATLASCAQAADDLNVERGYTCRANVAVTR